MAAAANKSVFFHADGSAKSVRQVYDWALAQPGGEGTVRVAQLPDITPDKAPPITKEAAYTKLASAHDAQIQMLLQSVMNWQPKQNGFSALFGSEDSTPSSAMSFGPGLLSLLSDARNRQF